MLPAVQVMRGSIAAMDVAACYRIESQQQQGGDAARAFLLQWVQLGAVVALSTPLGSLSHRVGMAVSALDLFVCCGGFTSWQIKELNWGGKRIVALADWLNQHMGTMLYTVALVELVALVALGYYFFAAGAVLGALIDQLQTYSWITFDQYAFLQEFVRAGASLTSVLIAEGVLQKIFMGYEGVGIVLGWMEGNPNWEALESRCCKLVDTIVPPLWTKESTEESSERIGQDAAKQAELDTVPHDKETEGLSVGFALDQEGFRINRSHTQLSVFPKDIPSYKGDLLEAWTQLVIDMDWSDDKVREYWQERIRQGNEVASRVPKLAKFIGELSSGSSEEALKKLWKGEAASPLTLQDLEKITKPEPNTLIDRIKALLPWGAVRKKPTGVTLAAQLEEQLKDRGVQGVLIANLLSYIRKMEELGVSDITKDYLGYTTLWLLNAAKQKDYSAMASYFELFGLRAGFCTPELVSIAEQSYFSNVAHGFSSEAGAASEQLRGVAEVVAVGQVGDRKRSVQQLKVKLLATSWQVRRNIAQELMREGIANTLGVYQQMLRMFDTVKEAVDRAYADGSLRDEFATRELEHKLPSRCASGKKGTEAVRTVGSMALLGRSLLWGYATYTKLFTGSHGSSDMHLYHQAMSLAKEFNIVAEAHKYDELHRQVSLRFRGAGLAMSKIVLPTLSLSVRSGIHIVRALFEFFGWKAAQEFVQIYIEEAKKEANNSLPRLDDMLWHKYTLSALLGAVRMDMGVDALLQYAKPVQRIKRSEVTLWFEQWLEKIPEETTLKAFQNALRERKRYLAGEEEELFHPLLTSHLAQALTYYESHMGTKDPEEISARLFFRFLWEQGLPRRDSTGSLKWGWNPDAVHGEQDREEQEKALEVCLLLMLWDLGLIEQKSDLSARDQAVPLQRARPAERDPAAGVGL